MKAKIVTFIIISLSILKISGQGRYSEFVISGYRCVIIPSEIFAIKTSHPEWSKQYSKGTTLHIELTDATGRMPKDTVFIYTDDIKELILNFSTIEMAETLEDDSLSITLAAGSRGEIKLSANLLKVNIGAGSELTLSGEIDSVIGKVEGNSHLESNNLKVFSSNLRLKDNSTSNIRISPLTPNDSEESEYSSFVFFAAIFFIVFLLFILFYKQKKKIKLLHRTENNDVENEVLQFRETSIFRVLTEKELDINSEYMPILEQKDLYEELKKSFPNLISIVRKSYPSANWEDIYLCILSALKLKNKTIAFCMRTTTGSIRTRKNRIKQNVSEKIFLLFFSKG